MAVTDWDVLAAVRDALVATGEFDLVAMSDLPSERGRSAGDRNAAFIHATGFRDVDSYQDGITACLVRHVDWTLTVAVRRQDPEVRDRELCRLLAVAQNAIDGQSLGGLTIPVMTRLRHGKMAKSIPPERQISAMGEFAYLVEGFNNHPAN